MKSSQNNTKYIWDFSVKEFFIEDSDGAIKPLLDLVDAEAKEDFESRYVTYCEENKNNWTAWNNYAVWFYRKGDFESAHSIIKYVFDIYGNPLQDDKDSISEEILANLAAIAYWQFDECYPSPDFIEHYYKALIKLNPDQSLYWLRAGNNHFRNQNFDKAAEYYRIGITKKGKKRAVCHYSLGMMYGENEEFDKAIYHYEESLKVDPDYDFSLYNLACRLDDDEDGVHYDPERAFALYQKAALNKEPIDGALVNVGIGYLNRGDYAKAMESFDRAIADYGFFYQAVTNKADVIENTEGPHSALEYLGSILKKENVDDYLTARLYEDIGDIYRVSFSQNRKAIRCYKKALKTITYDYNIFFGLGYSYSEIGKNIKAAKLYLRILDSEDDYDVEVLNNLAIFYFDAKLFDKSCIYYERILSIGPDPDIDPERMDFIINKANERVRFMKEKLAQSNAFVMHIESYLSRFANWFGNLTSK